MPTFIETALKHWRIAVIPAIVVLLVVLALCIRFCGRDEAPTLSPLDVVTAQQAIENNDRSGMIEVLVKNDLEQESIDANVAEGRREVIEAANASRQEYQGKTNEELAEILNRRAKE